MRVVSSTTVKRIATNTAKVANAAIAQHVHRVTEAMQQGEEREQLLLGLLDALLEDQAKTCIVFVNRKAGAEELASRLR